MQQALSWDVVFSVLAQVCIVAVLLERALAVIFEHRLFVAKLEGKGLKEIITVFVAYVVCKTWGLDAIGALFAHPDTHKLGVYITALTVAGGSKVPATLFTQVWDIRSSAARNGGAR